VDGAAGNPPPLASLLDEADGQGRKYLTVHGKSNFRKNKARLACVHAHLDTHLPPSFLDAAFPAVPSEALRAVVVANNNPCEISSREAARYDEDELDAPRKSTMSTPLCRKHSPEPS
jgi:hypothetical protein